MHLSRACGHSLRVAALGVCAVGSIARADFINGGFENNLTGWTVEYGSFTYAPVSSISNWSTTPSAWHTVPTTVASYTPVLGKTYTPPCGAKMAKLTSINLQQPSQAAVRINQLAALTAADFSDCGAVLVRVHYVALFDYDFRHDIGMQPHIAFGLVHNTTTVDYHEYYANDPNFGPYTVLKSYFDLSQLLAKEGVYEYILYNAAPGDTVQFSVALTGCAPGYHTSWLLLDCAEILPADEAFSAPGLWTTVPETVNQRAGDANGDGLDDIVQWDLGNTASVRLANAGGSFGAPTSWGSVPPGLEKAVGDFNGDGRADVAALYVGTGLLVSLGQAAGGFAPYTNWSSQYTSNAAVRAGDFNGDGRDDVLTYNVSFGSRVYFAQPGGGFAAAQVWSGAGWGSGGWYVGDFNGDERADLARDMGWGVQVLLSTGTSFGTPTTWSTCGPGGTGRWYVGDFDCDGVCDLLRNYPGYGFAGIAPGRPQVLHSTGKAFDAPRDWAPLWLDKKLLYVGDYDGSGAADIARWSNGARVYTSCMDCPCGHMATATVYCDPLNATNRIWRVRVRNLTRSLIASVTVTPAGFSALPPTVTLSPPLKPGYSRNVEFLISGATPQTGYCPLVTLTDTDGVDVCAQPVCFDAPECDCMRAQLLPPTCAPDGSGDVLLHFQVLNATGVDAEYVRITAVTPPGSVYSPTLFDIPTLPTAATSGVLETRLLGAANVTAGYVCVHVELLDGGGSTLCDDDVCVDIPSCPQVGGYCCTTSGCVSVPNAVVCAGKGGSFATSPTICIGCWSVQSPTAGTGGGGGATILPCGEAVVSADHDGNVVIHELSDSGLDGAALDIGAATTCELDLFALDPFGEVADGASLSTSISGHTPSCDNCPIGTVLLYSSGGQIAAAGDFTPVGAGPCRMVVFASGVEVAEAIHGLGVPALCSDWPAGMDVRLVDDPNAPLEFALRFADSVSVMLDGQASLGDELRIQPLAAAPVSTLARVQLTTQRLPRLTLPRIESTPLACPGDFIADFAVDLLDVAVFQVAFGNDQMDLNPDVNGDGQTDWFDVDALFVLLGQSCP